MTHIKDNQGSVYVVGCFDTKFHELHYIRTLLEARGISTVTVDVSTLGKKSTENVMPEQVAAHHPGGCAGVFTGDRGTAIQAMTQALEHFIGTRTDVAGIISAAGSCGTALVTPAMRSLSIGLPKMMVSTVASGNVAPYIGVTDICMMYSVTDIQGINRISAQVMANAAHALAGMLSFQTEKTTTSKPALGLTMFGVTTTCVQGVIEMLGDDYDGLVFHATGAGGQAMERLADSGLLAGIIDVTTTEVADLIAGGIFSASEDRFGAVIRTKIPYVGSCGALDMVNFGEPDSVPEKYRLRNLYRHNPQITLMRTTPEENIRIGRWIAARLNQMTGPVRFLLPLGGLSMMDAPGSPFYDPEANRALFSTIEAEFKPAANRKLIKHVHAVNDVEFSAALFKNFLEITNN